MLKARLIVYLSLLIIISSCTLKQKQLDYTGLLLELDENGNEVWRTYEYKDPGCLNKDKDGNHLIADHYTKNFFSLDKNNNINWIYYGDFPIYIEKLENDNYLLVSNGQDYKVYEVNEKGKFINGLALGFAPITAHKNEKGNYIVMQSCEKDLMEFSPDAKELWSAEKDLFIKPESLQIIDDENFLIVDEETGSIFNYNKKINKLEEIKNIFGVNSAVKLKNGNYVYSNYREKKLVFINPKGNVLKTIGGLEIEDITLMPDGNIGVAAREYKKKNAKKNT